MEQLGRFITDLRRELNAVNETIIAFTEPDGGGPVAAQALYLRALLNRG